MTDFTRRIATLTLPLRDNDGKQLKQQHELVRASILDRFGGYTQSLVTGAWKGDDGTVYQDDNLKYEIAMTTGKADGEALVRIAGMACLSCRQICVMVVLASGVVHFINERGEMI